MKSLKIVFSVVLIACVVFAGYAFAQSASNKGSDATKLKLDAIEKKLEQVLANQEKIFNELNVLKIRIRRS